MLTRACIAIVDRMANDPIPPYDWRGVADEVTRHARSHLESALEAGLRVDLAGLSLACFRLDRAATRLAEAGPAPPSGLDLVRDRRISAALLEAERTWVSPPLVERPWYRNTYISDDPRSGHGASPLFQSFRRLSGPVTKAVFEPPSPLAPPGWTSLQIASRASRWRWNTPAGRPNPRIEPSDRHLNILTEAE